MIQLAAPVESASHFDPAEIGKEDFTGQAGQADGFALLNLASSESASQNSTGQGHPQTTAFSENQ
jgi:hypothetical protein